MQKFLHKLSCENIKYLINRLGQKMSLLFVDIYGNYFCQKLIQCCSSEQRTMVLKNIESEIVNISYDNSGTHALQSLFELTNLPEEETLILNAIKDYCLDMCYVRFNKIG